MAYESTQQDLARARKFIYRCKHNPRYDEDGAKWMKLTPEVKYAVGEIYLNRWTRIAKSGKVK